MRDLQLVHGRTMPSVVTWMNMETHVPGGMMRLGLGTGTSIHLPNGHLDAGKLVRDLRSAPSISQLHFRSGWDKQLTACSHSRQMDRRVVMKSVGMIESLSKLPGRLNAGGWIGTTAISIGLADDAVAFVVHA